MSVGPRSISLGYNYKGWGLSLENARRRRNLTQEELAELIGVSKRSIVRWEQEESVPDVLTAFRMSEALGIAVEDLFL